MEYEELQKIWNNYDNKLDKLEKLNLKLVKETLIKKPSKKIALEKFRSIYGLIVIPAVLILVLHPYFTIENIDTKFIIGCILILGVAIYLIVLLLNGYSILNSIDIGSDSVLTSAKKIARFKKLYNSKWKYAIFYYPLAYIGTIFIVWKSFNFNTQTITSLTIIFIITYVLNIIGPREYTKRVQKLEKEILELKEYTE